MNYGHDGFHQINRYYAASSRNMSWAYNENRLSTTYISLFSHWATYPHLAQLLTRNLRLHFARVSHMEGITIPHNGEKPLFSMYIFGEIFANLKLIYEITVHSKFRWQLKKKN